MAKWKFQKAKDVKSNVIQIPISHFPCKPVSIPVKIIKEKDDE